MHLLFHIQHLIHQFGYTGVFFILLLEMIGFPFPAETILTITGMEWNHGTLSFAPLLLASALGNIAGSTIAYGLGRFLGREVIIHFGKKVGLTENHLERAELKFQKYRNSVIFWAKFIAWVRVLVPYLAGINRMSFTKFTLYNSVGAFVWATVFILLGKYLGKGWLRYHRIFDHFLIPSIILFVLIIGFYILLKRKKSVLKK